jgi:peptidoglycan LD-endopeptidase CwlK
VVILCVLIYFVLVLSALAWWLLPPWRERVYAGITQLWQAGQGAGRSAAGTAARSGGARWEVIRQQSRDAVLWVRARSRTWLAALALLVVIPAAALGLRHWWTIDGFDHTYSREANPQVAALLQGEQLVPPAPLPPELFLTREVELAHPKAGSANRQWELLDAEFRQRLLAVFKVMREEHGFEMVLIEGYRSPERQAELAGMGTHVTRAGAGESWHQYGLAADCAFLVNGRIVISEADPVAARGYALFGAVAQSVGLVWGGSWRSIKDLGHIEMRRTGVMERS